MKPDRVEVMAIAGLVGALYALAVEWAARHWFHAPKGVSGSAILLLFLVWGVLADRRSRAISTDVPPTDAGYDWAQALATVLPALCITSLFLLPQLVLHRWWELVLVGAVIGFGVRLWRMRRADAPVQASRPNGR